MLMRLTAAVTSKTDVFVSYHRTRDLLLWMRQLDMTHQWWLRWWPGPSWVALTGLYSVPKSVMKSNQATWVSGHTLTTRLFLWRHNMAICEVSFVIVTQLGWSVWLWMDCWMKSFKSTLYTETGKPWNLQATVTFPFIDMVELGSTDQCRLYRGVAFMDWCSLVGRLCLLL